MAGMLRHDSSSIISSLQNYGDSDEEENDPNNKSIGLPFEAERSEEKSPEKKSSPPQLTADPSDKGLSFSAQPQASSDTNTSDNVAAAAEPDSADPGTVLAGQDAEPGQISEGGGGGEEKPPQEVSPAELISDDEGESSASKEGKQTKASLKDTLREVIGEGPSGDSPTSQGSVTKPGRQAARLVSYGPDEDVDDDETSSEEEEEESPANSPDAVPADNSALSRSVRNMSSDEIQIPPEPPGKCSAALQKKIEDSFERMRRENYDLNRIIQSKKHFRNPSIYEKLIDFCHIDEKGTNFPPELYDPHIWGKESVYDELDKAQRKDMERREKEKKEKTKIEFLTGTKKSGGDSGSSGPTDEKRRKTKWDAQPPANIHVAKLSSAQQNPGVVNLTATATGTKATIIPAMGSLSKKSSSSSGK